MAASLGGSAIQKDIDNDLVAAEGSRIATLEHALDQALLVIADLRAQLQVQTVLEEQLAETESCSHIQKKAILSLKQQLRGAEDRLEQCQTVQDSQTETIAKVREELSLTAFKKEELERQVDHLSRREAQLQHQCLEMSDRCEQQEIRIQTLVTQMAELQEQVLHQAQLLREQEMATQHWKGRCQSVYYQCQALVQQLEGHELEGDELEGGDGLAALGALKNLLETASEDDRFSWHTLSPSLSSPKVNLPPFLKPKPSAFNDTDLALDS